MSIERLVALLTPVFGVAAGALTTGIGSATGVQKNDLVALFVAGTLSAVAAALKWLHGRQRFVAFESGADALEAKIAAAVRANAPASVALADIESALKAHTGQIVAAIGSAVHAPPSAQEVAKQILDVAAANAKSAPPPTLA